MIIGIDLDNTIIKYDKVFKDVAFKLKLIPKNSSTEKKKIKELILLKNNGIKSWKKIQGLVYGKYINKAEIMPSVYNFIKICRKKNYKLYIISHKTKYGHFDSEKILLRNEAIKWLKKREFFDKNKLAFKKEDIFFANTRKQKIKLISKLKCDWFIDDLPEIFKDRTFPKETKKILFMKENKEKNLNKINLLDWTSISNKILGPLKPKDILYLNNFNEIKYTKKIIKVKGHGNSQLYKISTNDKKDFAVKYYPDLLLDSRPRLKKEYETLKFLAAKKNFNVPKPINKNYKTNIGLYEWIEGKPIKKPTNKDINEVIKFVKKLKKISISKKSNKFNMASEACLSAKELIKQIHDRFKKLNNFKRNNIKLKNFLDNRFSHTLEKAQDICFVKWPNSSQNRFLQKKLRVLSPSDFGFHNVLKNEKKMTFIDFEYFGWDDPVKLTADFLWHPSMNLSNLQSKKWQDSMLKIFKNDKHFKDRLKASIPLYGLRWVMIILNEFTPGIINKRQNASRNNFMKKKVILDKQMIKANKYLNKVEDLLNSFDHKYNNEITYSR